MRDHLPPAVRNPGFNAQHAPAGAFLSFTCGCFGAPGGLGVERAGPARQNVFIGVKSGSIRDDAPLHCLPFFAHLNQHGAADFEADNPNAADALRGIEAMNRARISRYYGWATDCWRADDLTFAIDSPFGAIPEPGNDHALLREALLPAVIATLTIDNRQGRHPRTAVFGIDAPDTDLPRMRPLDALNLHGFAWGRQLGFAGRLDEGELVAMQCWSLHRAMLGGNLLHALGTCGALAFEVPPGRRRTLTLALGVYRDGVVTTGLEGRYWYTKLYDGLADVLGAALDRAAALRRQAEVLDGELRASGLSADQQFLLAHATRSYYAATQLIDVAGQPWWIVNEGEYRMMNTLDLTIDQAFWELRHNPWVVRNVLDRFRQRYHYHDALGVSFTHDMGANNHFAPPGHSSYELPGLTGCFSYMTQEQLCNWVLTACCYAVRTRDVGWVRRQLELLEACAASLRARADADGLMIADSARCAGGAEVTTYDSLDESLGQARCNTYIAVKCWATWLALEVLHHLTGRPLEDSLATAIAERLVRSTDEAGTLPAVLDLHSPGHRSRILPVVEGLVYPAYWLRRLDDEAARSRVEEAMCSPLIDVLRKHTIALLRSPTGANVFADGGIRLSSTSDNSWMSKIAIFQFVARSVLRLGEHDERLDALLAHADAAHVRWQTCGASYWACSDQFIRGQARASRYYPRIVAAALWLDESPTAAHRRPCAPAATERSP